LLPQADSSLPFPDPFRRTVAEVMSIAIPLNFVFTARLPYALYK
jgi:hypothetical protein